jgi:hypothetical protein
MFTKLKPGGKVIPPGGGGGPLGGAAQTNPSSKIVHI